MRAIVPRALTLSCCLVATLAFAATPSAHAQPNTGVVHLFNGRDLSTFYTWLVDDRRNDPDRVFTVVDHVDGAPAIRISGQKYGGLTTPDEYETYRLVVEFRWGAVTWKGRSRAGARQRRADPLPGS